MRLGLIELEGGGVEEGRMKGTKLGWTLCTLGMWVDGGGEGGGWLLAVGLVKLNSCFFRNNEIVALRGARKGRK